MNKLWEEGLRRRFTPAEVEAVTGVSTDMQRLWSNRYHDFRLDAPTPGGHKRWFWAGVQAMFVFSEILADLGNASIAQAVAVGTPDDDGAVWCYEHDLREPEGGDLLLTYELTATGTRSGTLSANDFARLFRYENTAVRPQRALIYNLSDMQRRLAEKAGIREAVAS